MILMGYRWGFIKGVIYALLLCHISPILMVEGFEICDLVVLRRF